jgi:glutamate synthase domain-containing protein 3
VGENLAAGMTGGELFIHDPEATVADRMDQELVVPSIPDPDARARLREMVERHRALTCSAEAARLLEDWVVTSAEFLHIVPRPDLEVIVRLQEGTVSSGPGSGRDDDDAPVASVTRS